MNDSSTKAERIPIVTTISARCASKRELPLTGDDRNTREVEEFFELQRSRYFGVGRTYLPEKFGDVALVYSPEIESRSTGSATPFDSGTIYWAHCHPLKKADESEQRSRARQLVDAVNRDLNSWRDSLAEYLDAFFGEPKGYLRSEEPDWDAEWGPEDLPAKDRFNAEDDNVDWRAWSWEVRLYNRHRISDGLVNVACSRQADDYFQERARASSAPDPDNSARAILECGPIVDEKSSEAFDRLETSIQETI